MQKQIVVVHGTSADPPHTGHREIVVNGVTFLESQNFAVLEVIILPVFRHPAARIKGKHDLPITFAHRFAMCTIDATTIEQSLRGKVDSVVVSRLEEELGRIHTQPNYTAETLAYLRNEIAPEIDLVYLIGEDLVSGESPPLGKWRDLQKIIQLAGLAIFPRPGYTRNEKFLRDLEDQGAQCLFIESSGKHDISSSVIKQRIIDGEDPMMLSGEGLISNAVARYIKKNGLVEFWGDVEAPESERLLPQGERQSPFQ